MYTKKDEKSFKRRRLEGEERGKQNKIGVAEIRLELAAHKYR